MKQFEVLETLVNEQKFGNGLILSVDKVFPKTFKHIVRNCPTVTITAVGHDPARMAPLADWCWFNSPKTTLVYSSDAMACTKFNDRKFDFVIMPQYDRFKGSLWTRKVKVSGLLIVASEPNSYYQHEYATFSNHGSDVWSIKPC